MCISAPLTKKCFISSVAKTDKKQQGQRDVAKFTVSPTEEEGMSSEPCIFSPSSSSSEIVKDRLILSYSLHNKSTLYSAISILM